MNFYDKKEKENTLRLREELNTLPSFCKEYFRAISETTTSKTRLSYSYDLHIFFNYLKESNPIFKNKKNFEIDDLDKVTFQDIYEYMEYLKFYSSDKKETTNSESGIKRKIASLRSFYKYFYNNELIKTNPASKVSLPKLREKEITRLEVDEVAKLMDLIENGNDLTKNEKKYHEATKVRDMALISLLLGTGMRVSECVGINLDDIDLENTAIRIKRKGAKEAIIYYSDEVAKYLDIYLKERKNIENIPEDSENALFLSLQNKRISVRAVEKLVKKYALKINPLKHITPHKLRSTFGTNLYRETDDIYLVASVLGHNDVNTTKKHYAAIDSDKKRNARNVVRLRND